MIENIAYKTQNNAEGRDQLRCKKNILEISRRRGADHFFLFLDIQNVPSPVGY